MESRVNDTLKLGPNGYRVKVLGPILRWEANEISALVAVMIAQDAANGLVMAAGASETYLNPNCPGAWVSPDPPTTFWDADALVAVNTGLRPALVAGAALAYAHVWIVDAAHQVHQGDWTVDVTLQK